MIIGAIDVGSNSVKFLVASVERSRVTPLAQQSAITRLSGGLDRTGSISPEAQERTIKAIRGFLPLIAGFTPERIVAVATEAARVARNGRTFAERCGRETGVRVRIIPAREEARLSFLGATAGRKERHLAAIDIGGGSTEVIYGKPGKLEIDVSVPLGAVRLTEKHLRADPPTLAERLAMLKEVHEGLSTLPKGLIDAARRSGTVLGIGGTCVTLARMVRPKGKPGSGRVSLDELESLLEDIAVLPLAQRERVPGIDPERADIILGGARILVEALRMFDVTAFTATAHGLRWGLVLDQ
ncbi:MAG TPA: hypothetical protein VJU16_06040 [Planctomycetota bacterium]|nr:hypothetical protein [Planctomycetota bacterium]